MSVVIATIQTTCNTSTGDQSITTTKLGGLTPIAAIFQVTSALSVDTITANCLFGYGFAVSTTKRCAVCSYNTDGKEGTVTDNVMMMTDTGCVLPYYGGASADGKADFVSWDTNGCTINWSNAPGGAYLLTVTFIAGTDVSAYLSQLAMGNADAAVTESGMSFQPDILLPLCANRATAWDDTQQYWDIWGVGFVKNGGNKSAILYNKPFYGASDLHVGQITTSYGCGFANYVIDGSVKAGIEFGSFGASGFTATAKLSNDLNGVLVRTLCLKFTNHSSYVGTFTTKTSTGTQAYTGVGFKPQNLFGICSTITALDTSQTAGFGWGIFSADTNKDSYTTELLDSDGQANSSAHAYANTKLDIHSGQSGTSLLVEATLSSYDSDGFTWNYSTADGTARYCTFFAVQEDVAAAIYKPNINIIMLR